MSDCRWQCGQASTWHHPTSTTGVFNQSSVYSTNDCKTSWCFREHHSTLNAWVHAHEAPDHPITAQLVSQTSQLMWSQGKAGCPVVIDNNSQQVMESPLFAHCMLLFTKFIHSINYSHVSANVFTESPHFIPSLIHCTCLYFVYWLPPSDHSVSMWLKSPPWFMVSE